MVLQVVAFIALALFFTGGASAGAASLSPIDRAALHALEQQVAPMPGSQVASGAAELADRMAEAKVPAVSIAFFENGNIKWSRAYGVLQAGSPRLVNSESLFQAASLSKAVTAAAALRMVDAERLSLDRDVGALLRKWHVASNTAASEITLRRLLSHTAGLSIAGYPGYRAGVPVPSLVDSLAGKPPANTAPVRLFTHPGKQMAYSGGGYSVAQLLLTETAGADFPDLMRRYLLRPAGMTRSSFQQGPSGQDRNRAYAHDEDGKPIPGGGHVYPELAAAGLWTTPSDYARFLIALQDSWHGKRGALLRPASARAMTTPIMAHYGLGVSAAGADGRWFISHGGSNEGFQCRFAAFLDGSRQGVVIMTNGEGGGRLAAALQRTLARVYGWPEVQLPPTPRAPDA